DLAFDWFHLTPSGEAKVSAAAWAAGFFSQPANTLGKTSIGSLTDGGGANWLDSSGPYTLGASSTATKLTAYVRGGSSAVPVRTVIYSDSNGKPGALVAVSQQVTLAAGQAAGWVDFPLSSSVGLGAGKYWLGFWYGGSAAAYYYDAVAGSEAYTPD